MSSQAEILKQIRSLSRGSRGPCPAIIGLADSVLSELFEQLKRGLTSRSVARYLRKNGMKGSENSLQQSVCVFRKRIAPLLGAESAPPSLPQAVLKLPAEVSCLPADEILSTATDIVKAYGEWIRHETVAAVENGAPMREDLAKHVKAYSGLVATKARLEATVVKSRPVGPAEDQNFDELANRALDYIGSDGDKMVAASQKFLVRLAEKCIQLEQDSNGEWVEAPTQRPGRRGDGETAHEDSSVN